MSSTNVKIKASTARSGMGSSVAKSAGSAHDVSQRSNNAAAKVRAKAASALTDSETKRTNDTPTSTGNFVNNTADTPSVLDNIADKAKPYLGEHGREVTYGIIGIIAAILILTIGFWPVLLLAVFAAIGIAIARFRDSGINMQAAAKSLAENLRR